MRAGLSARDRDGGGGPGQPGLRRRGEVEHSGKADPQPKPENNSPALTNTIFVLPKVTDEASFTECLVTSVFSSVK